MSGRSTASPGPSSGGAINISNLHFTEITNTNFSYNTASDAGAIFSWNTDTIIIDGCNFIGNIATSESAGAISINGDENEVVYSEIKNTSFLNNSCSEVGGAIWIGSSIVQIGNVDFIGNKAGGGGAISGTGASLVMINCSGS